MNFPDSLILCGKLIATDTHFKCLEKMLLTIGSMNAEWFFNFLNYVRLEMNLPP